MTRRFTGFLVLCLALAACGERDIRLRNLSSTGGEGPEEFAVLPVKPLEQPESYNALPVPTPGASNRTDPTPIADGVAALGGNPARLAEGGPVPASDGALVRHAARNGVPQDIRQTLASEDLEFRSRQSRFTRIRIFRTDRYAQAYRRMTLDASAEAARWRARGVPTPSAPPR